MLFVADVERMTESETSMPERRRGLRIRQNRPVKVFEPTVARYFGGQTEDISNSGLRLELPASTPVRPGKILNIHVGAPDSINTLANRMQMMPARVIWVDREHGMSRGRLLAGIELLARAAAQVDAA